MDPTAAAGYLGLLEGQFPQGDHTVRVRCGVRRVFSGDLPPTCRGPPKSRRTPATTLDSFPGIGSCAPTLANEDLEHTLVADEGHEPVRVITSMHVELLSAHPEYVIDTAVSGTQLQERLVSCSTVAEAWAKVQSWVLPTSDTEISLLETELANVQYPVGAHPKRFFARIDTVVNKLALVGVTKSTPQILKVIMERLPTQFRMEKAIPRSAPNLSRELVEKTIGDAYAAHRQEEIIRTPLTPATPAAPAAPAAPDARSDPHAFFVGGYQSGRGRGGGGGIRGRGRGLQGNRGFVLVEWEDQGTMGSWV